MKQVIVIGFLFISSQGVMAMSILSPTKTCVFSEVRAQLMMNGEPVANARVIRQWHWSKRKSDKSMTDSNGVVTFPAVYESSISTLLPTELVIGQQLSVEVVGEEKVFWTNSKRKPKENAEYGERPFDVVCELSDEEVLIEDYGTLMVTMCNLEQ